MAHWLMKSEPDAWSWEQQVKKGERAFFYHSNVGKEIVGIVEVIKEAYPDHTDKSGVFVMVDVKAVAPLPKPVSLQTLKADPRFADMALIKYSRLSVQPVTETEWRLICEMGGAKP